MNQTVKTTILIICAVALPNLIGWAGSNFTRAAIPTWYEKLKRPSWRPPNIAFPIVWTALYTTMGAASYLIYRDGGGFNGPARLPLTVYGVNLILNGLWTPLFFGAKRIDLALADILALIGVIGGCVATFYPVNKTAAYMMIPYLLWTSFASLLNFKIWLDNPSGGVNSTDNSTADKAN
ncbi:translocator protein-like isoform X1 [Panonychus citri]|uniref:translocator protein-like isoform X1 n=1 Tax=Panonychus citri TaxID=50023 RepID=UPI002307207E|nr:translocator protein-like isoform X1 [Panonychus citri]XP_053203566.1 translocator protein-like isoform X1 [Panonychus citri]XP_053204020.1 translocator protein-like isoform X1 [Panonychus citri]